MRFLIMTDIEGVTGVTTFTQAENSDLGRKMLMHDLNAVISGIRAEGHHEIVVYDMHTDGRNVDISQLPADVPAVCGKPIDKKIYRSVSGPFDGLFLLGLHTMQHVPGALLAHSYLREYDRIILNGRLVGEIGIEAALAGEQGIPLRFVSGDDLCCAEAEKTTPEVVTAAVKKSIGDSQALCYSTAYTKTLLFNAAKKAAAAYPPPTPYQVTYPVAVQIEFSECPYLHTMKRLHPEIFTSERAVRVTGDSLLDCWSSYLTMEREMVSL